MARPLFLIADDTPGKLFFLTCVVKKSAFPAEIIAVKSAEEAMKAADEHPEIVAAFIDYRMGMAGGPAAIEHLRRKCPSAKIALVTASYGESFEREAKQAGADVFFSTAYSEPFVVEKLNELLASWKADQMEKV